MKTDRSLQDVLDDMEIKRKQAQVQAVEADRFNLTEREVRIMEYFWSREKQVQRRSLPLNVVLFLEQDRHPPGGEDTIDDQTTAALARLIAKELLRTTDNGLELNTHGVTWMLNAHPPIVRWWQRVLERVPPLWQIAVAAIGLVASINGVIQFGIWIAGML